MYNLQLHENEEWNTFGSRQSNGQISSNFLKIFVFVEKKKCRCFQYDYDKHSNGNKQNFEYFFPIELYCTKQTEFVNNVFLQCTQYHTYPSPHHPFHHHPSYRGGEHDRLLIDWLVSHTRWLARFLCKSKIFWSASIHHINSETILRSRISGDQPTQNWLESICQTNIISHKKSA